MCPGATAEPEPCSAGGFCKGGNALAAPCPTNTYSNNLSLASASQCKRCPKGSVCRAGSTAPQECSPGTYASEVGEGEAGADFQDCTPCEAGSYQPSPGGTGCSPCTFGHFCPERSSVPIPCPPGTYGNATGLGTEGDCQKVEPGFHSSLGSTAVGGPRPQSRLATPDGGAGTGKGAARARRLGGGGRPAAIGRAYGRAGLIVGLG